MANLPARVLRLAIACLVTGALLLPSAAPVGAAAPEDKILRVGTMQDLDSMNPWNTALTTGFEVFNLNYEFLVGFGSDLAPAPGFAESWSRVDNGDGTFTWTFKIPEGKTWSDGTPATAEDARWTLQFVLDAVTAGNYVGLGYLDPDLTNAGVTKVEAPDATTLVVTNTDPSDRILQMYIPMLPKHIWQDQTLETIPTFANEAPVVGSGPYQAVEWKTGEFVRLVRNPTYQWTQGAADEVVIQFFKTGDTMVQGLKTGDLDYAHGINSDQFDSLKGATGHRHRQRRDERLDDAQPQQLRQGHPGRWGVDQGAARPGVPGRARLRHRQGPADRTRAGRLRDAGDHQVPLFAAKWHVEPDKPRTFDIDLAKQKLDAAGYPLDASGKRLDKEGKPITLRLFLPTDLPNYPKSAPFIKEWFGELGIDVVTSIFDEATLIEKELPPEAGDGYTADWDMILWGWTGYADPNPLLQSLHHRPDRRPERQPLVERGVRPALHRTAGRGDRGAAARRHGQGAECFVDQAPYHVLYYEDTLVAYRTDKFGGWQNQPANGVPLFGYGPLDYTLLTPAVAPTPVPSAESTAAAEGSPSTPTASPAPDGSSTSGGSNTLPIIAAVAIVGLVLGGLDRMAATCPGCGRGRGRLTARTLRRSGLGDGDRTSQAGAPSQLPRRRPMHTLVVYELMFGNTHAVAEAIAQGLESASDVRVIPVGDATDALVAWADVVIVGGPTHIHGMTRATSRKNAAERAEAPDGLLTMDPSADGPGVRDWLESFGKVHDKRAAAFDTRSTGPAFLTGAASGGIAAKLRGHGFTVIAKPESFLVDKSSHLVAGEVERAASWGAGLAAELVPAR